MIRAYHQPSAVEDALALIARGAVPVAGATGLYSGKARRDVELVDVTGLSLGAIDVHDDRIEIGATATMQQIADHKSMPGMEGAVLRRCARDVASRPLRNMITAAGNLAHMVFWADLPVAWLALDATIEVRSAAAGTRQLAVVDCLRAGKQSWDGGMITKIIVPRRAGQFSFGFERLTRTATDYSLSTVCTTVRIDGEVVRDARVAVGAVTSRPTRMTAAEAALEGKPLDDATIAAAISALEAELVVAPNFRAPADYRKELTRVLARRTMETARTWATQERG